MIHDTFFCLIPTKTKCENIILWFYGGDHVQDRFLAYSNSKTLGRHCSCWKQYITIIPREIRACGLFN